MTAQSDDMADESGVLTVLEQEEGDEVQECLPQIPTAFRGLPNLTSNTSTMNVLVKGA
jgi:hypothetical protein